MLVRPSWDHTLSAGSRVFYVGDERLSDDTLSTSLTRR